MSGSPFGAERKSPRRDRPAAGLIWASVFLGLLLLSPVPQLRSSASAAAATAPGVGTCDPTHGDCTSLQVQGPWFPGVLSIPDLTVTPVAVNLLADSYVGAPPYSYNLDCSETYGPLGLPADWNLSAPPPPSYCDFGRGPETSDHSGHDPAFSIWDSHALPTGAVVVANDSPAGFNGALGSCFPSGPYAGYDCGDRTLSTLAFCANDTQPPSLESLVGCPGWFTVSLTVTLSSWNNGTLEADATPLCGGGGCPAEFCFGVGCQPTPAPVLYDWFEYNCPSNQVGNTFAASPCSLSTPYRQDFPVQDVPPDSLDPGSSPGWTSDANFSAGFSWQPDPATSGTHCSVYLRSFYVGVYAGWGVPSHPVYVAMSALQLEDPPVVLGGPGCSPPVPSPPPGTFGAPPVGWPRWLPWPWTLPGIAAAGLAATAAALHAHGRKKRPRTLVTPTPFLPPGPR